MIITLIMNVHKLSMWSVIAVSQDHENNRPMSRDCGLGLECCSTV